MKITEILTLEQVIIDFSASSSKQVLEQLAKLLSHGTYGLEVTDILSHLLSRERLGSTSIGNGVAIPHARIEGSPYTIAAFIRLKEGIDFNAIDNKPVSLFFALLVPEKSTDEHLNLLAQLATLFRNSKLRQYLREVKDPQELLQALIEWDSTSSVSK
ncbi:PTS sugar transporter subunit IIA [Candidatus Nitrosacidococcus tergens]|uniref:PTS IIA-like nitrogen-regulatory protein PtsN n=1 Tax=Candidatus Nitrosacidococcus tergens TaxID=553981 RepID=A0A7G1QCB1_9GAMM|nr:PTS sugar transporter subunit IIA [Candidatus Nitrosacidococcus tergens]CAB1277264.1 PTS IIA-like nitrogen-regulatory protein PtsN [Candidatus Nitrosacidococcus tergens]